MRKSDLQIIVDPAKVAEARRQAREGLATRDQKAIQWALETPAACNYYPDDAKSLGQKFPDFLLPGWREIVRSRKFGFKDRLGAAASLCYQHDEAGLRFLLDTLRSSPRTDHRRDVMRALEEVYFDREGHRTAWPMDAGEYRSVLSAAMNTWRPSQVAATCEVCKKLGIPGIDEKIRHAWNGKISPRVRLHLAAWLLPENKTREALHLLEVELGRSQQAKKNDVAILLRSAAQFLNSAHDEVAPRCFRLLRQNFPAKKDITSDTQFDWRILIEELGALGGTGAVSLLEQFLHSKLDTYIRGAALCALATILGNDALSLIEEAFEEEAMFAEALKALGLAFKDTGDPTQVARLRSLAKKAANLDGVAQHLLTAAQRSLSFF